MRGNNEEFDKIVSELQRNIKNYEDGRVKHYAFVDTIDNIFANYSWTRTEFYKELDVRLGIRTNKNREEAKKTVKRRGSAKK